MHQTLPLVSIIVIDYKDNNPYLVENLEAITKQTYKNYETILVTDYKNNLDYPNLRKKHYDRYVGPAQKRDDGAKMAKGDIVCFIDDDAYPDKNWLTNIVKSFSKKEIVGVGGPGVTPPNVDWKEESSGWASASPLGSGFYLYRFLPQTKRYVDDYPSMNLAVRRKDFLAVGGFDSNYWPGEDTKLCLDLVTKTGKKILYNPKVLVNHHRRPILRGHLRQNGNFGLHRGFFARVLPQTSLKPIYFLPSLLFLGTLYLFITTALSFRTRSGIYTSSPLFAITSSFFYLYLFLLFLNSLWIYQYILRTSHQTPRTSHLLQPLLSIPIIFITHLWYGYRFLQGLLFTDKLTR
jgi:glycosyltransferase involved in cell wall biosynthesis